MVKLFNSKDLSKNATATLKKLQVLRILGSEVQMPESALTTLKLLDRLETFYGPQQPCWPVDPYQYLVWRYCGYPASDAACAKGWESLNKYVGTAPDQLLDASAPALARALTL